jgi:hypothetical protein
VSAPFEAQYPDRCGGDCGNRIEVGDSVRYVNDVLVHVDCAPVYPDQSHRLPLVVCPRCHLTRPCEHDE